MKYSSEYQANGTLPQLRSKVKEVAGMISDCPGLHPEGPGENNPGQVRVKIGQFNQFWGK